MKKNIGTSGRILRFGIAVGLLIYAIFQSSLIALAASLVVFYEAIASWCVIYQLLGINKCPIKKSKH
jgi:hypothetical protein